MEKKTILFFQELYLDSVSQAELVAFCKQKQSADMQKNAMFMKQILVGDEAFSIREEYEDLMEKTNRIHMPEDILDVQSSFEKLGLQVNKYMLDSVQTLKKRTFMPEEIKVLHPVFEKQAIEKVRKMISFALYCLLCQNGPDIRRVVGGYLDHDSCESFQIAQGVKIYSELVALLDSGSVVYWRYVLRTVEFDKVGKITQFFAADKSEISKMFIFGKPYIYHEDEERLPVPVVEGKGYMTNMDPMKTDMADTLEGEQEWMSDSDLTLDRNSIWNLDFSLNPIEVLDRYFNGKSFVISPVEYFRFANTCMVFQRIRFIFGD